MLRCAVIMSLAVAVVSDINIKTCCKSKNNKKFEEVKEDKRQAAYTGTGERNPRIGGMGI